ncbi:hypothetical protein MKW94_028688 [Papaver nudicaule]|uniref:Uncharacterized protein n=1 Tax=Papaver nudicaule TaxID=74823 RepID=A0AA41VMF7_PAPNU|nr:hypothetical protein [Papaver nudicaule]
MEQLSVGKMDMRQPREYDVFEDRSKFISCISGVSTKKLYELLKLDEDQEQSGEFDTLDVTLSSEEIIISSLVKFSSPRVRFLRRPNEPLSFRVEHKYLRNLLRVMAIGPEFHPIHLAYQPEEKLLVFGDAQGRGCIEVVPINKKEISEALLHLQLNNSSEC